MALEGQWTSDSGIVLNGSDISSIDDQSGNGYTLSQTEPSRQPTLINNAYKGHPIMRFAGSEWLAAANNTILDFTTEDITLAACVINMSPSSNGRLGGKGEGHTGGSLSQYHMYHLSNATVYGKAADGSSLRSMGSSTLSVVPTIQTYIFTLASLENANMYIDGVLDNSSPGSNGSITTLSNSGIFKIGDVGTIEPNLPMVGDMFEFRVYGNLEDAATLHAEMLFKWDNPSNSPPTLVFNNVQQR